ncbi:MAG: hypothetical protein ABJM29_07190 [Rhizobiaceae bacterium]
MRNAILASLFAGVTGLPVSTALAEPMISECGGPARVDAIVEPWNEATRTFASGRIRIVALDTAEPACCSFHLAIIAPDPNNELGLRQCVSLNDGGEWTGFQFVDVAGTQSSYDPGKGLLLSVPVERYIDGVRSMKMVVNIRINQATGSVVIE